MRSIRPPIRRCRIRCWCPLCGRGVGIDRRCHCRRRRRRPWGRMDDGQTAAYPPEARLLVLLPLHLLHPLLRGRRSGGRGGTRRRPPPPCHRRRRGGTDPAGAGEAGRCGTSSTGYGPTAAAEGTADAGRRRRRWGAGERRAAAVRVVTTATATGRRRDAARISILCPPPRACLTKSDSRELRSCPSRAGVAVKRRNFLESFASRRKPMLAPLIACRASAVPICCVGIRTVG